MNDINVNINSEIIVLKLQFNKFWVKVHEIFIENLKIQIIRTGRSGSLKFMECLLGHPLHVFHFVAGLVRLPFLRLLLASGKRTAFPITLCKLVFLGAPEYNLFSN